jgi:hypothetical protein
VTKITSIRVLFFLASIYNFYVHQKDFKKTFLNGYLKEEVYLDKPGGFILPKNENFFCKLVKSLYGLKQAPKQWHKKFVKAILLNGFHYNGVNKYMYSKFTKDFSVIICLYKDDMLTFSTNMIAIVETKRYLSSIFKMKDLGELDTILDIKVKKHSSGYAFNQ